MSTLATLIGGVLLIVILYRVLSLLPSLPAVLRAVLASSLTLLLYFGAIIGRWPGLDVVAMHVSIYLLAGLLLYMWSQYRSRHTGRMHWVPKALIGFFVMLAVINTFLLYIATRGLPPSVAQWWLPGHNTVSSGFSGVVPHGQEAAKAVSSELNRSHAVAELGWRVAIEGLPETVQAQQLISVKVLDRTGLPITGLIAEVQIERPGATEAATRIQLMPKSVGEYGNVLNFAASGRWVVDVQLRQGAGVVYHESREVTVR